MKLLASQSGARMASDLRYAAAQTFPLMVAAADWIGLLGINEAQFKTMYDVVANLKGELRDSEVDREMLFEKNNIVDCQNAALEDHAETPRIMVVS